MNLINNSNNIFQFFFEQKMVYNYILNDFLYVLKFNSNSLFINSKIPLSKRNKIIIEIYSQNKQFERYCFVLKNII
jgi:hypothetical protein